MTNFLDALFGTLSGDYYVYLWTAQDKRTYSFKVDELAAMQDKAMSMSQDRDVYFGLGATKKQLGASARAKASDIAAIPGLWVDIDLAGNSHKDSRLPANIQEAIAAFPETIPAPTMMVWSGYGLHVYWLWRECLEIENDSERQIASRIVRSLQNAIRQAYQGKGWGLDNTSDLSRILRVPGTYNHKTPDQPQQVKVLHYDDKVRYNPSDFDNLPDITNITTNQPKHRAEGFKRQPTDGPAGLMFANCAFMRMCLLGDEVKYPELMAAVTNLVRASDGITATHELIKNTIDTYDPGKTEIKINEALEVMNPQGCDYIANVLGFSGCPREGCGVNAPCGWSLGKLPQAKAKTAMIATIDTKTVMTPDILGALAVLKKDAPAEYALFKDKCKGTVNLHDLEKAIKHERQKQTGLHLTQAGDVTLLSHFIGNSPIDLVIPINFTISDGNIYHVKITDSGDQQKYKASGNVVIVTKRLFNIDSLNEKLELAFWYLKGWRKIIMPRSTVFDARRIMQLSDYGVSVTSESGKHLVKWLDNLIDRNIDTIPVVQAVSKLGWRGKDFILPTYSDKYALDIDDEGCKKIVEGYTTAGSLNDWVSIMQVLRRYPRARFMLAASFAAPLLKILDQRNFIIHSSGATQSGKTATLWAALSVWGNPRTLVGSFNASQTSIERMAAFSNDLPLPINERELLGKFAKQDINPLLYMIAEGRGKGRGTKTGLQKTASWRTIALSTGEGELTNASSLGGLMTRVLEITEGPLVDAQEFAKSLYARLPKCHGHAGAQFLRQLTQTDKGEIVSLYQNIRQELTARFGDHIDSHIDAVAVVATADYLVGVWLFDQHDVAGPVACASKILEALPTRLEASESERAWLEFRDWLVLVSDRLNVSSMGEMYGYEEAPGKLCVIRSKVNEWINSRYSSARKILKEWGEAGYIEVYRDGNMIRYDKKGKTIKGIQSRVVKIIS